MRAATRAEMERWLRSGARSFWRPGGRLALHVYGRTPEGWPGPIVLADASGNVLALDHQPSGILVMLPPALRGEARRLLRMFAADEAPPRHGPRPWPPRLELVPTGD